MRYPAWPCPEALWSPTSGAFFLTYSNGGLVGTWDVRVYYPSATSVAIVDPAADVRRDFLAHYPRCFDPEVPNVAGIAWLGPTRLLVAAEVLPHTNCDAMGTFAAYEVELPAGRIVRKLDQLESKRVFAQLLGPELRAAYDSCIRQPQSCWIPALHRK